MDVVAIASLCLAGTFAAIPHQCAAQSVLADPLLVIGSVDGAAEYSFTEVVALEVSAEGGVIVADAALSEILWYDAEGRFLHRCGGAGDGPGEYRRIGAMGRYGLDSLFVVDQFALRVTILDETCNVGRTFRLEAPVADRSAIFLTDFSHVVGALSDGQFVIETPPSLPLDVRPGEVRASQDLQLFTDQGQRLRGLGVFPSRPVRVDEPGLLGRRQLRLFSTRLLRALGGSGLVVGDPESGAVRWLNSMGDEIGSATLPVGPPVSSEHVGFLRSSGGGEAGAEGRSGMERYLPANFPAFSTLLMGDDGNAWVATYPIPGDESRHLYVVAPTGERQGSFVIPAGLRPLLVRDGRLYGVLKDEFDIPYVQVFAIPPE